MTTQTTPALEVLNQLEASPGLLQENWCVPRETGRFIYVQALIAGAHQICEVGTSIGYSTVWLAMAAQRNQGHVDTLEYFEGRQQQAIQNVERAGLSSLVSFHLGKALDLLQAFKDEGRTFDLAFVDASKQEYIEYIKLLEAMMPSGAVLIADNTKSHRSEMLDFLSYMEASTAFDVAEVESPNGQLLARKR